MQSNALSIKKYLTIDNRVATIRWLGDQRANRSRCDSLRSLPPEIDRCRGNPRRGVGSRLGEAESLEVRRQGNGLHRSRSGAKLLQVVTCYDR